MKNRDFKQDYSMLSSYFGRFTTVIIFSAIIGLAIGALFIKNNDIAHIPINVGVCAFDSVRASETLEFLSDFSLEKGYGNINWIFIDDCGELSGCEFYLMTTVQYIPFYNGGKYKCSLVATTRDNRVYSSGAIFVRASDNRKVEELNDIIFSSPISATGFMSPYLALNYISEDKQGELNIHFTGEYLDFQRVVFSVLFGKLDACGLNIDNYEYLERNNIIKEGELRILLKGRAYPEIILVSDPSVESMLVERFSRSFPAVIKIAGNSLKARLQLLGMSGFIAPRDKDFELIGEISEWGSDAIEKLHLPLQVK